MRIKVGKRYIKIPEPKAKFSSDTDKPLRYFPVDKVFVRRISWTDRLFCDGFNVMMAYNNNTLAIHPALEQSHLEWVEAFLHDYAPPFTLEDVKPYIGRLILIHPKTQNTRKEI